MKKKKILQNKEFNWIWDIFRNDLKHDMKKRHTASNVL